MNFKERGFRRSEGEQGFLLLGLVVAIFIILLVLAVAAPTVVHELRRERDVETVHRGNQYVRAIQLYYRKFGHYPGSMEQLEKTNNIRFLRKQYVDPLTGKADWRLIKVGEAKTTVKGFFGKPLTGLAPGLGAVAGMASAGGIGAGAAGSSGAGGSAFGSSGPSSVFGGTGSSGSAFGGTGSSPTSGLGSSGLGSSSGSSATSAAGSTAGSTSGSDSSGFGSNSGMGSQSATTFTGGGAPFEGVGLVKPGDSIITLNEQTTYPTWEFIYDPRIEQLKAAAALQGGGANGLGVGGSSSSASSSGFGSSSSGFGSSSGSAFGSSSGSSGFGSSSPPNSSSPSSSSSPTGSASSFP